MRCGAMREMEQLEKEEYTLNGEGHKSSLSFGFLFPTKTAAQIIFPVCIMFHEQLSARFR